MPQKTNLNTPPYWDDFDQTKDFTRILFKPGVSVQVRELNQLQDLFQTQIERFGDNIFSTGTIVSGCNFTFYNPYPFIKIKDVDINGNPTIPGNYVGYNLLNSATGLQGLVLNSFDGFESSPPDLKTLYIKYNNSGSNSGIFVYSGGDVLTVYNAVVRGIEAVNVLSGGVSFSNTDTVIVVSQILCSVASGVLTVGDYLINNLGANVQIVSVNATAFATSNQVAIQIAPRPVDLANSQVNSLSWSVTSGQALTNPANTVSVTVNSKIGDGFVGQIITNGVGTVQAVNVAQRGAGYTYTPYVTIQSFNNSTGYNTLNLQAQNYLTQITVSSSAGSVGNGYAFGITQGVIYQQGYFQRVTPQVAIISKYSQTPDNTAVGFITNETIINSNIDTSLLDNVNNTQNAQAPGADRLQMRPALQVVTTNSAISNGQFLSIVQWKEGNPYQQQQQTVYSIIGDEMATRTNDAEGNFVVQPFLVTTRSPQDANQEGQFFNVVIDPGLAYIDGYRVATSSNFNINDYKGVNTAISNNQSISLAYGNYVTIANVAGAFRFNIGDIVQIYDTAQGYVANATAISSQTFAPVGNIIGNAAIRSLAWNSNQPGTQGAQYNLYLFNVQMAAGKNFANAASVFYNGAVKGIGDIVLSNTTIANNIALIQDIQDDQLVFYSGLRSLKNANAITYTYRTNNTALTISNGNVSNATLIMDVSAGSDTYPFSGSLVASQLQKLYVVPTNFSLVANNAATGTVSVNTTTVNCVGTSTTWLTTFAPGDWITVTANSTGGSDLKQVVTIVNNTFMTVGSALAFTNAVATFFRTYPANLPVPFGFRAGLSANVNINLNILTLDFGTPFAYAGTKTASLAVDLVVNNPTQLTKTPNRNQYVLFACSNNAGGTAGPWCMGVPDCFRLRGVYIGNSTVSNTGTNYVSNFFIDSKQNADFYNLSYLNLNQSASVGLTSAQYLLVQFDYFTSSGVGFYDTVSYTQSTNQATIFVQDSTPFANLGSGFVNSFEVPELFTDDGTEIDLLNWIDFRPYVANTTAPSTVYSTAPLNPANTVTFSVTGEKKFPSPATAFNFNAEYYLGRLDSVFVDQNGVFSILQGQPQNDVNLQRAPKQPEKTMKILDLIIPTYPNLPSNYSGSLSQILNTGVINQKFLTTRIKSKTIRTPTSNTVLPYNQPKVYTMSDIGNIDRRLAQVEYYVTLNTLEVAASQLVIPSSVNPTLNRFQFGIFVDNFTSSNFSALQDPQYQAIKQGGNIVPTKLIWDLVLLGAAGPNWFEETIVLQADATYDKLIDPLGAGPVCALNLANTVAYVLKFRNSFDATTTSLNGLTDTVNLTFANSTTVVESIKYANTTINQTIQNAQYTPYVNYVNLLGLSNAPFSNFNINTLRGLNSVSYDPATQTITYSIEDSVGKFDDGSETTTTVTNIPAAVGQAFVQVLSGTITYQQYLGTLQTFQQAPTGGTFVGPTYHPPVAFYFYNYAQGTKFQIFQNGVLIGTTDTSLASATVSTPSSLSNSDITLLTGPTSDYWFNDSTSLFLKTFNDTGGGYATYAGKILFNYDPTKGENFSIVASSPSSTQTWKYVVAYPINGASVGCIPPSIVVNPTTVTGTITTTDTVLLYKTDNGCGNEDATFWRTYINTNQYIIPVWTPFTGGPPTTSIVPFDTSADWATVLAPGVS